MLQLPVVTTTGYLAYNSVILSQISIKVNFGASNKLGPLNFGKNDVGDSKKKDLSFRRLDIAESCAAICWPPARGHWSVNWSIIFSHGVLSLVQKGLGLSDFLSLGSQEGEAYVPLNSTIKILVFNLRGVKAY